MRTKTAHLSEHILTVAARLFATHRFHEARMEDIAAEAGVGKGTLYRYFKDKEELYLALLERGAEQYNERLQVALEGADGPQAKLEAIVEAIITFFDERPHLFDVIQHAEAMRRSDSDFPWQQTREQLIHTVEEIFEEGNRAGVFHVAHPEITCLMLLGGLRAVIRFGRRPRPAGLARDIVTSFLYGAAQPRAATAETNGHGRPPKAAAHA